MKKILTIIFTFLCIFVCTRLTFAEKIETNIAEWNFEKLMDVHADQDENVIVSRFFKVDNPEVYGFCLQANEKFKPKGSIYYIDDIDNDYIFNIVKAYEEIGRDDDNYFIAAQILIWEETNEISYTFAGNDYSKYKNELLDYINLNNTKNRIENDLYFEVNINEVITINDDYTEFNIESKGIEVIENTKEEFSFKISDLDTTEKYIKFKPKTLVENQDKVLISETSQDIYYFDGDYNINSFLIHVNIKLPDKTTVFYSKKDEFSNPIIGAEFSLYEIDDKGNFELVFLQTNTRVNLYEMLLDDYYVYDNLKIEVSERYEEYIENEYIFTEEIGYFPYKIFSDDILIKEGIVYVTNDTEQTNNYFNINKSNLVFKGYSENKDINIIDEVDTNKTYYLCESEPAKGYTYKTKPCYIVDTSTINNNPYEFINETRTYTLRLIKQSPEYIPLNGALFKISYIKNDNLNEIIYTTGTLLFNNQNDRKYLVYKHENEDCGHIQEFKDENIVIKNPKIGKYYYYETDINEIDYNLLKNKYVEVIEGGFNIYNLPYSSSVIIQEIKAPTGYVIDNSIIELKPNIKYSEIYFKNYRVNYLDIIPSKRLRIPKTCVDE